MDFVDAQFANRPEDLERLDGGLIRGLLWRRAAIVQLGEELRTICLGFNHPGARVVCIGITGESRRLIAPLGSVDLSQLQLVSRAKAIGKQPGLSITFLLSYAKFLEEYLVHTHHEQLWHEAKGVCLYETTYTRLFPKGADDGLSAYDALSFCAATIASEQFFAAKIYGGIDSVDELFATARWVFRKLDQLGESLGDEEFECLKDLDDLQRLWQGDWKPEHFERQQHLTALVLSLLRTAERAEVAKKSSAI